MARFYFHIHNSHGVAEDEEGMEASSLSEASETAITGIRDLIAAEAKNGRINFAGRIDISGEAGEILLSIPFADAVQVEGMN